MVIEDEEMVMNVTRAVLVSLGYRDGQIDLSLLDIKLPDISGD